MALLDFAWTMTWWVLRDAWKWVREIREEYGLGIRVDLLQEMSGMASMFFLFQFSLSTLVHFCHVGREREGNG